MDKLPTVFHITHHKAGSQWVLQVLRDCAPERVVKPLIDCAHINKKQVVPGLIYPTAYLSVSKFTAVLYPFLTKDKSIILQQIKNNRFFYLNWWRYSVMKYPVKGFVIIRDLRDALVSFYFSVKYSHPVISAKIAQHRKIFEQKDFDDGMILAINSYPSANVFASWGVLNKKRGLLNYPIIRYEDLVDDELEIFTFIMDACQINVKPELLKKVVDLNRFESRAGRRKGDEDIHSHLRKGIVGDWKNYFSDQVKVAFKNKYGKMLIQTGYEKDENW